VIWYAPKLGAVVKSSHVSPGDFDFERAGYLPSSIRRRSKRDSDERAVAAAAAARVAQN
jgi:hypothetical protein